VCRSPKLIRTDLEDKVDLCQPAKETLESLPRARRRALWPEYARVWRGGLLRSKQLLKPWYHHSVGGESAVYGALTAGGCISIIGILNRKLRIFAVVKREPASKPSVEGEYRIIEERFGSETSRMLVTVFHVIADAIELLIWSVVEVFGDIRKNRPAVMLDILPPHQKDRWQDLPPWQAHQH
jgi:hypothetical protein